MANILVVEDDPNILSLTHDCIKKGGHEAFKADSAEIALDILKIHHIDVIITDIVLPLMDGLELTDVVKRDFDADIIVMTGYSSDFSYETAINKGASDFLFKPVRFEELQLRIDRVLAERKLKRERDEILEKLKELSITDGLTELYNSRHFYSQLKGEIDRSNRYDHPLSLLLLDLDNFKDYNDSFGHLEGDRVLVRIGRIIKSILRKMDTAYRYGGEEFTVILPEATGDEAEMVAERLRLAISDESFDPEPGEHITITVSTGVTEYIPPEKSSALVGRADRAMYKSKQDGRNRVTSLVE